MPIETAHAHDLHKLVLLCIADDSSAANAQKYLESAFNRMPLSIYALPTHNVFDFALVGPINTNIVKPKVVRAHAPADKPIPVHFDGGKILSGTLARFHGERDPTTATIPSSNRDRLYAMILFHHRSLEIGDEQDKFCARFEALLNAHGWDPKFCLVRLIRELDGDLGVPDGKGTRARFTYEGVIKECTWWVRFHRVIHETNPTRALDNLSTLFSRFKEELCRLTCYCFPAVPVHEAIELQSLRDKISTMLSEKFPTDTKPMVWSCFEQSANDVADIPDVALPLGHYVISAEGRCGKSNVVSAVMKSFLSWRAKIDGVLKHSQAVAIFDVLYLNLKDTWFAGAAGKNLTPHNIADARAQRLFMNVAGHTLAYVRPKDLGHYFAEQGDPDSPRVAYTEPDGSTDWFSHIRSVIARTGRGLLLVIDEAFSNFSAEKGNEESERRADGMKTAIRQLCTDALAEYGSLGLRLALVGQRFDENAERHSELGKLMLRRSTVIIGVHKGEIQGLGRSHFESVVHSDDDRGTVSWMGCDTTLHLDEAIKKQDLKGGKLIGPIIVRPALSAVVGHAIPCHVVPIDIGTALEAVAMKPPGPEELWWSVSK